MLNELDVLLALMIIGSFLLAIPLHEWAHAQMASMLGDRTGATMERKTLKVSAHIDPVGTLMCAILAFLSYSGLGWGKPVKPDPWKMRVGANLGVLLVALAGPVFSLIVGLVFAALTRFLVPFFGSNIPLSFVLKLVTVFAAVNTGLAIFNIIPLYPLDGYQILYTLLPSRQAVQFSRSATYGPFIILILFFFLPFLGQLSGMSGFFLFQLATDINTLSLFLNSLVAGFNQQIPYVYGADVLH
jgi:Zn-dependent protease